MTKGTARIYAPRPSHTITAILYSKPTIQKQRNTVRQPPSRTLGRSVHGSSGLGNGGVIGWSGNFVVDRNPYQDEPAEPPYETLRQRLHDIL